MIFRTEMIYWRVDGQVLDRGEYHLVRSPANPTYYGGNLLYFDHPPVEGDYTHWLELFESEFKDEPNVKHVLFMWDLPEGETGAVAQFIEGGFEIQSNVTLMTDQVVPPPKLNSEIKVRRIEANNEWDAVLAAKLRARNPRFDLKTYTPFKKKWLDARRRLADQGLGNWYGAYIDNQLVGDLGLFRDGTIARFQDVGTEPEFRQRGICGTLVYEVSRQALESNGIETLVMVADENYHAARIYESVGFRPTEWHASACRYPPGR